MKPVEIQALTEGTAALRLLREEDLALTLSWRNHPESRSWFHTDAEIAWDDHVAWFQRYEDRDDDYVFILTLDGVPAAQVSLYGITGTSAEFGRLLVDPDARGQGAGGLASRLCLQAADELLGLSDLHLEVKEDNQPAIRIYRELGFIADHSANRHDGSVLMRRPASI